MVSVNNGCSSREVLVCLGSSIKTKQNYHKGVTVLLLTFITVSETKKGFGLYVYNCALSFLLQVHWVKGWDACI